jgi:cell division protein FtsN
MKQQSKKQQRGGTLLGFIVGVVVGLTGALAVAVYVTKVPIPFMNKSQSRTNEQDAAETKKNKDWDPNAALYGKNPVKAIPPAVPSMPAADGAVPAKADAPADPKADPKVDPKAAAAKPAASADPLGDLVKAKSGASEADQFMYFVQVGSFRTSADAESHRAKLALSGIESKVSEREQSGRVMYRVRVGPQDNKDEGEKAKEKLEKAGLETTLVRVQRSP